MRRRITNCILTIIKQCRLFYLLQNTCLCAPEHLNISYLRHSYLLTHSTQQSPSSEANSFSACQLVPRILWNPNIHYRIDKIPPPVYILSQINSVHTPTSHFLKSYLNIILPSTPRSSEWSLSLRLPQQNSVYTSALSHACYLLGLFYSLRFDHPKRI